MNVSPLTHSWPNITLITKLHFPLLWFFLKEKGKRKTNLRDKMIPGHMDKDNKNWSYYRVFKHKEVILTGVVSINHYTRLLALLQYVWFVWFYSRTVRLTNCSLIQRSESHSRETWGSKVVLSVTDGISSSMEMNAVDQWRLRLLFTTTGHLGTLICCIIDHLRGTVKTFHKALLEWNYG